MVKQQQEREPLLRKRLRRNSIICTFSAIGMTIAYPVRELKNNRALLWDCEIIYSRSNQISAAINREHYQIHLYRMNWVINCSKNQTLRQRLEFANT